MPPIPMLLLVAVLSLGHLLPATLAVHDRVRDVDTAVAALVLVAAACLFTVRQVASVAPAGARCAGGTAASHACPWLPREQVRTSATSLRYVPV